MKQKRLGKPLSPLDRPATVKQICRFMQIDPKTLRSLVQSGDIPHVRVKNQLRFVPRKVVAALEVKAKAK